MRLLLKYGEGAIQGEQSYVVPPFHLEDMEVTVDGKFAKNFHFEHKFYIILGVINLFKFKISKNVLNRFC